MHLPHRSHSDRGSALVLVTLVSVCVALVIGVLLQYALTEARINRANVLRLEAKNAAEAALEYGAAELAVRFNSNRNFNSATLAVNPVTAHSTRLATLYTPSADSPTTIVPGSIRLYVSNTSSGIPRRIDANDPENAFDPLRGQTVNSRFVRLLATATARSPGMRDQVVYASQAFEVRDSQLFNYAIFYNLPMEFHPAPDMEIWGPVHSNEDAFLTAGGTVHYRDSFTSAGRIIANAFSTTGRPTGRNIHFATGQRDANNVPLTSPINGHSFRVGTTNVVTHVDSDLATRAAGHLFSEKASQLWHGKAQDVSLGVERQNPPGVHNPTDARKLIDPPDTSDAANASIEEQKFSRQAGLYVFVDRVGTAPRVTLFRNAEDAVSFKAAPNRAAWISTNPDKVLTPPAGLINPNRRMRDNREGRTINMIDIDLGRMRTALRTTGSTPDDQRFRVNGANWDYQAGWTGAVYVEVESPNSGFTTTSDISAVSGANAANIHGAGNGSGTATAVRLINGQRLPSLAPSSSNPHREHGFSFATNAPVYIAGHFNANGVFGTSSSPDGSERSPDPDFDGGAPLDLDRHTEVPALVAGDSINVLSAAWVDSSGLPVGDGRENNLNATRGRVAVNTEVSAVFMGGIVQTPANGDGYSGGVENYPRFHEDWGSRTLRYRGSIVALFTSTHATGRWGSANVYGAPIRRWGFHDFLRDGKYPPFTPSLRTFRRIDFRDITRAEYEALLADTALGFRLMSP